MLGFFHSFQSCLELAVADEGQFMASSHTGQTAAPAAKPYQLYLIHVWKLSTTLIPFPKCQKISKELYTEIRFPLKLAFKALYWSKTVLLSAGLLQVTKRVSRPQSAKMKQIWEKLVQMVSTHLVSIRTKAD